LSAGAGCHGREKGVFSVGRKKWIGDFLVRCGLAVHKGPQRGFPVRSAWQRRLAQLNEACERANLGLLTVAVALAAIVGTVATVRAVSVILDICDFNTEHIIGTL
jgi:hypothetical protein